MAERPNILFICTDQQFGGAMSCAGNDELNTPAMDSLAERGLLFENAYCTYPICIPSRQSLLTGMMPHKLGYRQWGDSIDPQFAGRHLGHVFRDAGYDTVYGGKVHTPGDDPAVHGFRNICEQDDNALTEACLRFLREPKTGPFLLFASFDNPHNICEWARHEKLPWGEIEERPVADCPNLPANFAIPPFEPEPIRWIQRQAPLLYPTVNFSPDDWRRYRNAYYRLIEKVDGQIGEVLKALDDAGLREDTLIVFTSDHGDGHGAHQWNQKSLLYEESVRIPLIVVPPGGARPGRERRLVSNGLDLFPTLCDYAGMVTPEGLPGRSLRPLLETADPATWREELFIEAWPFQGDSGNTQGRAVVSDRYKYIIYRWGRWREQLFDRERDPGEMVNLAVNHAYAPVLEEHRARLRRYCKEQGDAFARAIPAAEPKS